LSIQPELLLRTFIIRGVRELREKPRLIDQLFNNLPQDIQQGIRDFLHKDVIQVDLNYPRASVKLPSLVLLLRSEDEAHAFLGDTMGVDSVPEVLTYDDFTSGGLDVLGGAASLSTNAGEGELSFGPAAVLSATANTLKIANKDWCHDEFLVGTQTAHIVGGTGVGQIREIVSTGLDTIMVSPNWSIVPDTTSVFVIRKEPVEHVGEPSSLYTTDEAKTVERLGNLEAVGYQLQIITGSPERTIFLHTIVKAILTRARQKLEALGVINFKLSATDFVPQPAYAPDLAYMRVMNIDFLHPFNVFVELEDLATSFRTVLENKVGLGKFILSDTTC